jgi:hypothetical protein
VVESARCTIGILIIRNDVGCITLVETIWLSAWEAQVASVKLYKS